ncbi:MAG: hypothetical protein HYW25_02760 [Candidatus Aenigmarchaeota archaeon]|nr:hypothetical protein [Candidatus Aenigmarchaeota archaeon]
MPQFIMQVIDIDYILKDGRPVVRIFGKKPNGASICVMVEGFAPYFYCDYKEEAIEKAKELGLMAEVVERKSAVGYKEKPQRFCKIFTKSPQDVPNARATFGKLAKCYEADILFSYRYMVDSGTRGMGWISVDGERIQTTTLKSITEAYVAKTIKPIDNIANAPLRYMCIDIESLQLDPRRVPEAGRDPIIIIAIEFYPEHKGRRSIILVAKRSAGLDAVTFDTEKDMLEYFRNIVEEYDPDVVTGYNVSGYDLPYIEERMRKHKIKTDLGRSDKPMNCRKFAGSTDVQINGRVVFDTYQIIKRDPYIRLLRYDLGTVARSILGSDKHEMKYTEIPQVWAKDTQRLVEYARQDAHLAMQLLQKTRMLDKFIEIAKISGVLLQDSFRGQSVRIESMLLREYAAKGMIIPQKPEKLSYEHVITGGAVLEPVKGLHTDSVVVLDFQSLYPSIIKTYNLSPDSLILGEAPAGAKCHEAPNSAKFLDMDYYEGVFPKIIDSLLKARREVKRQLKNAKGDERLQLDAKQYALKIMANSFYGYSGYVKARLFAVEMANAITAYGRESIFKAKEIAERDWGVKVLYSDTDSLFLKVNSDNLEAVQQLGEKIARDISEKTGLVLEFEKIYKTFLILTKKRYAGWKFEKEADGWKEGIDMRGIETVRRDWCGLVTETLNDILLTMLKERDIKKSVEIVKGRIGDIAKSNVPLNKLVIIKGITKTPSAYDGTLPHIELAKKMARRNPGSAPGIGDRIGFVIVRGKDMLSKRAEDPDYVKEKGLQIDADYYVNNQLLPPVERILEAAGVDRGEIMGTGRQSSIFDVVTPAKNTCSACGQSYRRIPLKGVCDCGGMIAEAV